MVTYNQATLCFPGSISPGLMPYKPKAVFSKVSFTRNGCVVEAIMDSVDLPLGSFSAYAVEVNSSVIIELQQDIVESVVKTVSDDLETIDDLLPELMCLNKRRIIQDSLIYDCEVDDKKYEGGPMRKFKVYDYSQTFSESDGPKDKLFSRVRWFKGTNPRIVAAQNRDLINIAEYINHEDKKIPHVEGNTLRQAVERAVEIYNLSDRLRKL